MMLIASIRLIMPKYKGRRNTITFPQEMYEVLEKIADKEERSVSQVVVRIIRGELEKQGLLKENE